MGVDRPDQAPFRRNLTSVRDEVSIRAPAWSYSDRRLHIGIQAKQIRRVAPLVTTAFAELNTGLSPDGRWIAYQSNASGQFEIYVQSFPNVEDGRWQISTDGGNRPAWGPDRDELFYLTADALMAVRCGRARHSSPAGPLRLFRDQGYVWTSGNAFGRMYDVAPDGQRFLVIR